MLCPNCGEEIRDNSKFCDQCGLPIYQCAKCGAELRESSKFCDQCGLPVYESEGESKESIQETTEAPKYVKPKRKSGLSSPFKIFLIIFLVVWFLFYLFGYNYYFSKDKYEEKVEKATQSISQKDILVEAGMTTNQANNVLSILSTAKIQSVKSARLFSDGESGKIYEIENVGMASKLMVCFSADGMLGEINVKMSSIQIYSNGEVKYVMLTDDEKRDLRVMAELAVGSYLKSPSTADFPSASGWKYHKNAKESMVSSYVDSQNSFGAVIRSDFMVTFDNTGKVTSLIFDGEEMIK